jgi:hypothetical protein
MGGDTHLAELLDQLTMKPTKFHEAGCFVILSDIFDLGMSPVNAICRSEWR